MRPLLKAFLVVLAVGSLMCTVAAQILGVVVLLWVVFGCAKPKPKRARHD